MVLTGNFSIVTHTSAEVSAAEIMSQPPDSGIPGEDLADYVRRIRNKKGMSLKEVERRSAHAGPRIGASYINRIENRIADNPTTEKLQALARGLGVSEDGLFAVARGSKPVVRRDPVEDADEITLTMYFRELPPERRADLLRIAGLLHSDHALKPAGVKRRKRSAA